MKKINDRRSITIDDLESHLKNLRIDIRKDIKQDITQAIEESEARVISVIDKALEDYPTKEELKNNLDGLEERLSKKIDKLSYDVSDLRNRVIDVELAQGMQKITS